MAAVEGNVLRRFIPALLNFILLLHLIGYVPSVNGDCIWYGLCYNYNTDYHKKYNCLYNGPARPIEEETRYILDKYCPQFASGPVCCNSDQLKNLKTNIVLVENILARCPSCMGNFMQHICGMTCSPNQSDFIKPVSEEQFNSTHKRVTEIDYHLSATYKEATFDSCLEIPVPIYERKPNTALDLMCGDYDEEHCTADRWFQYMGAASTSNPIEPLQINFVGGNEPLDGYTPYNPPTRQENCYETELVYQIELSRKDANTNFTNSEENSTISNNSDNFTSFKETCKKDKFGSCVFNCEMLYHQEQNKLKMEEDYYNFKKNYYKEKLVLLRQQTEALKTTAYELQRMNKKY